MDQQENRLVEFERLNLLGKAVFVTGAAARLAADLLEKVVDRAADVVADAERAFRQGRDPNVDDAKILEERPRPPAVRPPQPRP
ncbi:MAG TPA: hypothetical protein VF190_04445 [Rhodothermales bacterium]